MQCAEKEDKNGRGRKEKEKTQLPGIKWEKPPAPRAVAAAFFKECQCAGCKCNIRSKVFIIIVIIIIIMKNTVMYLFSKNKLIHSLQFDINIVVDLTCIYSSPPPPHTSLLIYSTSAGSIRVLLSQCTLSKLFYLFKLF